MTGDAVVEHVRSMSIRRTWQLRAYESLAIEITIDVPIDELPSDVLADMCDWLIQQYNHNEDLQLLKR